MISPLNSSVACVCFLSWQADFLEIRVSSEGVSVVCLSAKVTDVGSDDLVQETNPIFFIAGFD